MTEDDRPTVTDRFLSVREVAKVLGLGTDAVYGMLRRGQIPGLLLGREWRVSQAQLIAWFHQAAEAERLSREAAGGEAYPEPDAEAPSDEPTGGRRRPKRRAP